MITRRICFDFAKDGMKLQQNALEVLDQVALVLEKHPRLPIVVEVCLGPGKATGSISLAAPS